jgi:hypothetical protein
LHLLSRPLDWAVVFDQRRHVWRPDLRQLLDLLTHLRLDLVAINVRC